MNDPKGSIWRKWDLHIHTPASYHWLGGKRFCEMQPAERAASLTETISKINSSDVAAFGIMDYWTFDGYLEIRKFLLDHPEVNCLKTIFPGMELRIEAPVDYRLNIHVLLSNQLKNQQLHDFKAALKVMIAKKERTVSDEALIEFAKTLDKSKALIHGFNEEALQSDDNLLKLGSMTAEITRESLRNALKQIPEGAGLIILPYDTSDGFKNLDWKTHPHADNYFMQSAHIFETRDPDNVDLFLCRRTERNEHFIENFKKTLGGKPKPAVSGSDAHKISDYGSYPNNRITWIKADTTFEGLKQVVNEPVDRSFIGELPEKEQRVLSNKTKYIRSVQIDKKPDSTINEIWFKNNLVFNHDLVAIIGNKGNGKSALADIIGLLGNTKQERAFSFLNSKKFRDQKTNKAKHFQATLVWESGTDISRGLEDASDISRDEVVKYIPQNFLETICNEIGSGEKSDFERELEKVIFTHVKISDRLMQPSLEDLISLKTKEMQKAIGILKTELNQINEEIIKLEERLVPEHRQHLENQLKAKRAELKSHELSIPPEEPVPSTDMTKSKGIADVTAAIGKAKYEQEHLSILIQFTTAMLTQQTQHMSAIDRLTGKIENFKREYKIFRDDCAEECSLLGLEFDTLVTFDVTMSPLETQRALVEVSKVKTDALLDPENKESYVFKKTQIDEQIKALQDKLDEPNKKYQAYKTKLQAWSEKKAEIIGDENIVGSIKFYEKLLNDLGEIPTALNSAKERRLAKSREIYIEISRLAETYRELYKPVQEFIQKHPLAKDKFNLNFEVSIVDVGFQNKFFTYVSHGAAGSFYRIDEGNRLLKEILERHDFNDKQSTMAFLDEILEHLTEDKRAGAGGRVRIGDQLKEGQSIHSLYDFIFSFEYLEPRYTLKLGDRALDKLSPGERGSLLLIFYLLVDKNDIPLAIDQPEENLDNQTIYELLVPCIKEAKQRRQIIIVTLNPNLAVVCDAEQVIYASMNKADKNRITYVSGAIENPVINEKILDVLEGTRPAFDNRDAKYLPEKVQE